MKRLACSLFCCLFLLISASVVLADREHHGHQWRQERDRHHHHDHHYRAHQQHDRGGHHWGDHHWNRGGHHWRRDDHHHGYRRGHRHPFWNDWWYYDGWRFPSHDYRRYHVRPLIEFNFDWFGDPRPLLPRPQRQYEALPEEVPQQVVAERHVSQERLDALRTQAARDFRTKTPMPYDSFDSMSKEERRAYGEEWDRLKKSAGDKTGPFYNRVWRLGNRK